MLFVNEVYITKCKLRMDNNMYSTAKQLRFHTKELLNSVSRGEEVIITLRGVPYAKLVPIKTPQKKKETADELFGIWKEHSDSKDVGIYVRKIRKGRNLC